MAASITEHFDAVRDPRVERNKLYPLMEILLLVVCAMSSGAEGWEAMEEFGKEKLAWLRRFAPFAKGIPSHDCIASVISRLNPKTLSGLFYQLDTRRRPSHQRRGGGRGRQDVARVARPAQRAGCAAYGQRLGQPQPLGAGARGH